MPRGGSTSNSSSTMSKEQALRDKILSYDCLRSALNPQTLAKLPMDVQEELFKLLPECDQKKLGGPSGFSTTSLNNSYFNSACRLYMERLALDELSLDKSVLSQAQRRRDSPKKEKRPASEKSPDISPRAAGEQTTDEPPRKNSKLSAPAHNHSLADKAPTVTLIADGKSPPRKESSSEHQQQRTGSGGKSPESHPSSVTSSSSPFNVPYQPAYSPSSLQNSASSASSPTPSSTSSSSSGFRARTLASKRQKLKDAMEFGNKRFRDYNKNSTYPGGSSLLFKTFNVKHSKFAEKINHLVRSGSPSPTSTPSASSPVPSEPQLNPVHDVATSQKHTVDNRPKLQRQPHPQQHRHPQAQTTPLDAREPPTDQEGDKQKSNISRLKQHSVKSLPMFAGCIKFDSPSAEDLSRESDKESSPSSTVAGKDSPGPTSSSEQSSQKLLARVRNAVRLVSGAETGKKTSE